jgi:hypothetical protein
MPLSGEQALQTFRGQRNLWIGGRYGSYKTACSVRLAIEFMERGWSDHLICNFPCVAATDPSRLGDLRKVFIILDEGGAGNWLTERTFGDVVAFMRKRDLYLCVPSYSTPPLKARALNMQMVFDGHASMLDFVVYQMSLDNMNVHERNRLIWRKASEIYGLYDTNHIASDSGGILTLINAVFRADGVGREYETNPNDSSKTSPRLWRGVTFGTSNQDNPALVDGERVQDLESVGRLVSDLAEIKESLSELVVPVSRRRKKTSR